MTATRSLTVTLPAHWVEMIEARVAGGEFDSVDAFILARLQNEEAIDEVDAASPEFQAWLKEGDEIVARLRAGTEPTYPLRDVFDRLEARLQTRLRAEEQAADRKRA